MLFLVLLIPETPRWLAGNDRGAESLAVLRRLRRGKVDDEVIVELHKEILGTAEWEKTIGAGRWKDLVRNDRIGSQRRMVTACAVQIFQQLGGINAIICEASFSFSGENHGPIFGCWKGTLTSGNQIIRPPFSRTVWGLTSTLLLSWLDACKHGSLLHRSFRGFL